MYSLKKSFNMIFVLGILMMFLSCTLFGPKEKEELPFSLPMQSTMEPDFSNFEPNSSGKIRTIDTSLTSYKNWGEAVTVVSVWKILVTITLSAPIAVYGAALNQEPVLTDSGYVWKYSKQHGLTTYHAELLGYLTLEKVNWKMRVSGGVFTDFLWCTGSSEMSGTSGQWIFYETGSDTLGVIDWTRQSDTNKSIKITSKKSDSYGNYLSYTVSNSNRAFVIEDLAKGKKYEVNWNYDTKAGNTKATSDGATGTKCWDTTLQNTVCPDET